MCVGGKGSTLSHTSGNGGNSDGGGSLNEVCDLGGGPGAPGTGTKCGRIYDEASGTYFDSQTCHGGGGGGGSGIKACTTDQLDDCIWLLVVGGGAGATFDSGKPGDHSAEPVSGDNDESMQRGMNSETPEQGSGGGGGGGGYGEEPAKPGKPGGGFIHEDLVSDDFFRSADTNSKSAPGNPMSVDHQKTIGIPGLFSHGSYYQAGDGLVEMVEEASHMTTDVWIPVTTTCSCIVEPNAPEGLAPSDGKPSGLLAMQDAVAVNFRFFDHSGCETGFQVSRKLPDESTATVLDSEIAVQSACFEEVTTTRSGDPLSTAGPDGLLLKPGSDVQYCVRATGPAVGHSVVPYKSGDECTSITIKWVGEVKSTVVTKAADVGVGGVRLSCYLLTDEEHSDAAEAGVHVPRIKVWDVTDPHPPLYPKAAVIRRDPKTGRWRRHGGHRFCPETPGVDAAGLVLPSVSKFSRTAAGGSVTVRCPAVGSGEPANVTRTCSSNGNWGDPVGRCGGKALLDRFYPPVEQFIKGENLRVLNDTDVEECAWACLLQVKKCVAFQTFLEGSHPRCYLSEYLSYDDAVAGRLVVDSIFGTMKYYGMKEAETKDSSEFALYPSQNDLGHLPVEVVCSISHLATRGDDESLHWPIGGDGLPFIRSQSHLDDVRMEGCDALEGSLLVKCGTECSETLRLAWTFLDGDPDGKGSSAFRSVVDSYCNPNGRSYHLGLEKTVKIMQQQCPWAEAVESLKIEPVSRRDAPFSTLKCCVPPALCNSSHHIDTSPEVPGADYRIFSLAALRSIKVVSGRVEIVGCPELERFDGGLGLLREVRGYSSFGVSPVFIHNNPKLSGSVGAMLPSLPSADMNLLFAKGNPKLCVADNSTRFRSIDNAKKCGCTAPSAPNFNVEAENDDGSCDIQRCETTECVAGTSGRCWYDATSDSRLASPALLPEGGKICVPMETRVVRVTSDGSAERPDCSFESSCAWDPAVATVCARALCRASRFSGGTMVSFDRGMCRNDTGSGPGDRIRLTGPQAPFGTGLLQVRDPDDPTSTWGTVCTDSWDEHASSVACQQLGFSGGGRFATEAERSLVPAVVPSVPVLLDNVVCGGDEDEVADCQFPGWGQHDCDGHTSDVVLHCDVGGVAVHWDTGGLDEAGPGSHGRVQMTVDCLESAQCPALPEGGGKSSAVCAELCHPGACTGPDTPLPNCRTRDGAKCEPTTGECHFPSLAAAGAECDDGDPFTGPDTCDERGGCRGQAVCSIADLLNTRGAPEDPDVPGLGSFGVAVVNQDQLDSLRGCGTIAGNLHIACDPDAANPITDTSPLRSIARVTGVVRVAHCAGLKQLELTALRQIGGSLDSYALVIEDNAELTGFIGSGNRGRSRVTDGIFPSLVSVDGGALIRDNPKLCTDGFDWYKAGDIYRNAITATSAGGTCACTDSKALNYDSALVLLTVLEQGHVVADGSCTYSKCSASKVAKCRALDPNDEDCIICTPAPNQSPLARNYPWFLGLIRSHTNKVKTTRIAAYSPSLSVLFRLL